MMTIFLASMIAFDAYTASSDSQASIQNLYKECASTRLEVIASDNELDNLPPGTLIFLGTSANDIHHVVLCLNDGEYSQISSQYGDTTFHISSLTDLDFGTFPHLAIYKPSDAIAISKNTEQLHITADQPTFLHENFDSYFVNEQCLPFVLSPKTNQITLENFTNWAKSHQNELQSLIKSQGAILLRNFPITSAADFAAVVKAVIGRDLIDYKGEGSRERIFQGVYTSTSAPPNFKIPLHNELTCTINPVDYICFYCEIAPKQGTGQTLLGRTEEITIEMMKRPHIWNLFNGKNIKYISRHPPEGSFFTRVNPTHRTWQEAFETTDRDEVEKTCEQKGYGFKWTGDWIEVTRSVPAIRGPDQYLDHPYWFNQAHLYHPNPRIRGGWINHLLANLLYISPSTRQYDVEFDDGSPISREIVYEIYDVMDKKTIRFNWEKGDVIILDNRKTLHGRAPCVGQRRILTTMVQ